MNVDYILIDDSAAVHGTYMAVGSGDLIARLAKSPFADWHKSWVTAVVLDMSCRCQGSDDTATHTRRYPGVSSLTNGTDYNTTPRAARGTLRSRAQLILIAVESVPAGQTQTSPYNNARSPPHDDPSLPNLLKTLKTAVGGAKSKAREHYRQKRRLYATVTPRELALSWGCGCFSQALSRFGDWS